MKRYILYVIALAAAIAALKSCEDDNIAKRSNERIIQLPLVETTDRQVTPVTPAPVPVEPAEEERDYIYPEATDYQVNFVNNVIYDNLVQAKKNFESLLASGKVSTQMQNNGTHLQDGDVRFVDDCMSYMYGLVCKYVDCYQTGNIQGCVDTAKAMCDFDLNGFNKSYLFDVMVASKLPREFNDGTVHVDFNSHNGIYDNQGNIIMTNGRKLHVIGLADPILCATPEDKDDFDRIDRVSTWYCMVPKIITNQYAVVENTAGNDGICHVWNQTNVEACCRREWASIRKDGQSMYGLNPDTVHIRWEDSANSYIYEGPNGEVYGMLGYADQARVNNIYTVQDAVVTQKGDVYQLDGNLKGMVAQNGYTYQK